MRKLFFGIASCFIMCTPAFAVDVDISAHDDTPAFNAAINAVCSPTSTDRIIKFPAGTIDLRTKPMSIPCAAAIQGEGMGTKIIVHFSNGAAFYFKRGLDQSGGSVRDLRLSIVQPAFNVYGILVTADPDTDGTVNSFNRHSFYIDNITVTRDDLQSQWYVALYIDGSGNPEGNPNSVPGVRAVYVTNSSFGQSQVASIRLRKVKGISLVGVDCYSPGQPVVRVEQATDSVLLVSRTCPFQVIGVDNSDLRLVDGR